MHKALYFVGGFIVGGLVGWYVTKQSEQKKFEKEVEQFRTKWVPKEKKQSEAVLENFDVKNEELEPKPEPLPQEDLMEYYKLCETYTRNPTRYSSGELSPEELSPSEDLDIKPIDERMFSNDLGFEKVYLRLYDDNGVLNDENEVVNDLSPYIGDHDVDYLRSLAKMEGKSFYIRNEQTGCDICFDVEDGLSLGDWMEG